MKLVMMYLPSMTDGILVLSVLERQNPGGVANYKQWQLTSLFPIDLKSISLKILMHRYNFQPIQRYKALSAEEAEQEFGRYICICTYMGVK